MTITYTTPIVSCRDAKQPTTETTKG